ncbi:prefoldin subunit 1-like [Rhopalosiphum maidis]|uniref:Prefoldin subunit 1 n=1 Tax=Melanaphis sacchari TaxID=742174 RepID=A0A2H8TN44_9HEMI|nr:prefoldin subunit 1-like [Melanaphis sacchari]XP_026813218.1 prefoldin subunit 1-like [Rhopalosiphum maidis]XP_060842241.1 prefoldin subunit 1-like [Rhopalosiphum padi]
MAVDMDLKNAFKELHEKLLYASQKIKLADLQIDTLRRTKQHNILTKQELEKIPKDVKTYEALGRAFVLTPRDDVFKNLDKVNSDTEQKITVLENTKQYLEGNLKESENNLREMVQRKRDVGGDKENQPGSSKD